LSDLGSSDPLPLGNVPHAVLAAGVAVLGLAVHAPALETFFW
jgi:hypothetical protein